MIIDAVITWVDGNDPKHQAKRLRHGDRTLFDAEDVAGSTRFSSLGEIFYCIASLNHFAPWLHKIFIVTDEQDPGLEPFLQRHYSNGYIPFEIIDHKVIYEGYEEFLPTFNSISIETMTWRIPGLSQHYIEFNDDLILSSPVTPEDFFLPDGRSVCYATWYSMHWTKFTRMLKPVKDGRKRVTFKGNMYNAALIAGRRYSFLKLAHTPKALRRDFSERYFGEHPEMLLHNIAHRFRHAEQYTTQELQYLLLAQEDRLCVRSVDDNLFFLQPNGRNGYIQKKMKSLAQMRDCKFCCFNSLDKASEHERRMIVDWIENRLGLV